MFIFGFFLPFHCFADVKDDLRGINRKIIQKKSLIDKTKKVENLVSGELQQVEKNLQEKQNNLLFLEHDLKRLENDLLHLKGEMKSAETETLQKKKQINNRLSALYKAGDFGNLRVFFSSESFTQMMETFRYMKSVLGNDRRLFTDYQMKMGRLKTLQAQLEHNQASKEEVRNKIEAKKIEIEQEKKTKTTLLSKVRRDKQGYIASLKELQANAKRLQAMVERLEAKSRKGYTTTGDKTA
ncbi:MAG: peptidase M23, partial [Desulfuromonadales bacterium]|nr:peptidase M23 [Desulfuromonadales bacterium]